MAGHQTKEQERIALVAIGKADELSLNLFNLTEIVKLAAFAAESRRVLNDITNSAAHLPEIAKFIENSSECAYTWEDMSDSTGNVLGYISMQLDIVNKGFLDTVYDLAQGTERKGGAA